MNTVTAFILKVAKAAEKPKAGHEAMGLEYIKADFN